MTENNREQEEGGGKRERGPGRQSHEQAEKLKNFVFTRSQRGSDGFQKFLKISKAKVMENLTASGTLLPNSLIYLVNFVILCDFFK